MTTTAESSAPSRLRPGRAARTVAAVLVAGVLFAACGDSDDAATVDETVDSDGAGAGAGETTPADDAGDVLLDGTHSAWLTSIDGEVAVLEPVEVLSGEEAVAAAREDGFAADDEGLPNDVYVRDLGDLFYGVRLADGATIELLDCSEGCVPVAVDRAEFISGAVTPYGGPRPLVQVVVEAGEITSLSEQYLP
jgi:hypothetical protein